MTSHSAALAREIDAALAWWQAAGVDCVFANDARAWLADPASRALEPEADPARSASAQPSLVFSRQPDEPTMPAAPPRKNYLGDSPPHDLETFQRWWMEADLPGTGGLNPRIAPRGAAGAKLMVVVPDPEPGDETRLLSGSQGRLLANIIAAMGLEESECYIASALPCHTPLADLADLGLGGLDAVLACHITLAAPQRAVLFGQGFGEFLPVPNRDERQPLREINYASLSRPIMITETLGAMLDMPRLKARFWRRFMEWSA
jgi:uracil-DNA glycosylase